ncbi:MAG: helix-turn-helix domain-containing protein [Bacillota bacterium]
MNRFYKRYSDLIFLLLNEKKWSSIAEISHKTEYSRSTIWRDLEFLESIFPDGWILEKSEKIGVRLIKPENGTLESLLTQIREKNSYLHTLKLILLNDGVDIPQISQAVHISRSTAYRHLEKLQEVVSEAGVTLTASPFKVIGDEKRIRRFIMQYLDFMSVETNTIKDSIDAIKFQTDLLQLFSKYSMSYRTGALQRLTMILSISNFRVTMGHYISFPKNLLKSYEGSKYFELSKELVKYMVKCPSRDIQLQEILFFAIFIMSEERPLNRSQYINYIKNRMRSKKGFPLVKFLKSLSKYVGFNLSEDDIFLFHLVQTLKRIQVETEFDTEIASNSLLQFLPYFEVNPIFQVIEELAVESLSPVPLTINKLDVLVIFSLLQSAVLRKWNQHTIQVALMCRTYNEKDYIREVLKYHYGNKVAISTLDPSSIDLLFKYEEFDLLISTDVGENTDMLIEHIPTIQVSSFPSPLELVNIKQFIEQHFYSNLGIEPEMIYPFRINESPC